MVGINIQGVTYEEGVNGRKTRKSIWSMALNIRYVPGPWGKRAPRAWNMFNHKYKGVTIYVHHEEDYVEGVTSSAETTRLALEIPIAAR